MDVQQNRRVQKRWFLLVCVGLICLSTGAEVRAQSGDGPPEAAVVESPTIDDYDADANATNHPGLEERIEAVFATYPELERSEVGIHVVDLGRDEVLYTRDAGQLRNPASNVKLFTAAVILDELGPNHTFSTKIATDQKSGPRLQNLYIWGEGEAFLLYKDVLSWVGELRAQGIEAIDGDIVIDDSVFDEAYLPPGFDLRPSGAAWRSPIGAVSVNFNAVTATVHPGNRVGQAPTIRLDPPNEHVQVRNRARTNRGSLSRIHVSASSDEERTTLTVSGSIGINANPASQRKRVAHPPAFAGSVIAEALALMGIDFEGQIRRGQVPENGQELYVHNSQPVINAVAAMNKWSNNFIAEQLLRVLGTLDEQPSTWDRSRYRVAQRLETYGFASDSYRLNNGSGLYDGNEVSARQVVQLLQLMREHRYGPEFVSSLAIAGVDGTLRRRLDDGHTKGNLRAKTGTLRDVTALSGYVKSVSGRDLAFSILINDPPRRAWHYRDQQDEIARAIAGFAE